MQFLYTPWATHTQLERYLLELTTPHLIIIQKPKRTQAQNRCLHDNIQILANHSWYTLGEMKLIMKEQVTKLWKLTMVTHKTTPKGLSFSEYRSTAELDTKELAILMDFIFDVGQALGLKMHDPAIFWAEKIFT